MDRNRYKHQKNGRCPEWLSQIMTKKVSCSNSKPKIHNSNIKNAISVNPRFWRAKNVCETHLWIKKFPLTDLHHHFLGHNQVFFF